MRDSIFSQVRRDAAREATSQLSQVFYDEKDRAVEEAFLRGKSEGVRSNPRLAAVYMLLFYCIGLFCGSFL